MLNKVYYYTLKEIINKEAYDGYSLGDMIGDWHDDPSSLYLPFDKNDALCDKVLNVVIARFSDHFIFKLKRFINDPAPTIQEVEEYFSKKWLIKLLNVFSLTYDKYATLLKEYNTAKNDLMADITATSKNKVKFNDTPQNANTSDVYEGDNYITHFTSTDGETSSPLTSKIMRLKEIQDNYKSVLRDWSNEFEKLFFEEGEDDEL